MKIRISKKASCALAGLLTAAALVAPGVALATDESEATAQNTPAEVQIQASTGYKSQLESLSAPITLNGNAYILKLGSVTSQNKAAVAAAIEANLNLSGTTPLKLVHADFVDAEKWDYLPDDPLDEGLDDSALCWAASTASVLWSTGWAKETTNPETGAPFVSEDEVFTYFGNNMRNAGGEAASGLDWFFDGVYLQNSYGGTPWIPSAENMGLNRSLEAERLYTKTDMIDNLEGIGVLEQVADETPVAFAGSVGQLTLGEAGSSTHAVSVLGVIVDPTATSAADKYKAIVLANSDDDGKPTIPAAGSTDEQRIADRASRPNSYTVYPLEAITDALGQSCWKLCGYSSEGEEDTVLFNVVGLTSPTDEVKADATETEGSLDSYADSDFALGHCYTSADDQTNGSSDHDQVNAFEPEQDVYFTFCVLNKSINKDGIGKVQVPLKLTLTGADGYTREWAETVEIAAWAPGLYKVSVKVSDAGSLAAGDYTLAAEINPLIDGTRTIKESYYLNNAASIVTFTVKGEAPEPEPDPSPDPEPTPAPANTTPANTTPASSSNTQAAASATPGTGDSGLAWALAASASASAAVALGGRRKARSK